MKKTLLLLCCLAGPAAAGDRETLLGALPQFSPAPFQILPTDSWFQAASHLRGVKFHGRLAPPTTPDLIECYSEAPNGTLQVLGPTIGSPYWTFPGAMPTVYGIQDGDCHSSYGGGSHGLAYGGNPSTASAVTFFAMDGVDNFGSYGECDLNIQYYWKGAGKGCVISATSFAYNPGGVWGVQPQCSAGIPGGKNNVVNVSEPTCIYPKAGGVPFTIGPIP